LILDSFNNNNDDASRDIFWLGDESLERCEHLSDSDVRAQDIVAEREIANYFGVDVFSGNAH
jgi:hypothetical protein